MKQKTVKLTQTIKPSQFLRRDGVIDNADAKDTRTITVSFASEEPYEREFGVEILQVDNTALTMDRFANGLGCLLYNHNRDVVLGHIDKAWTDGGKAYQNGRKTPSFSYGDISPLSVKSSMDIDRKKFTLSIELDKHIQYNLNYEI